MSGVAPDPLDRIADWMMSSLNRSPYVEIDREVALALVEIARAARAVDRIYEGLRTDENDGEFALWSEDQLVVALHALRPALTRLETKA